jgi:hypothetical protein
VFQFAQLAEAETAVRSSPNYLILSETVRRVGMEPLPASSCNTTHGAVTRLPHWHSGQRRLGSANATRQHANGLLGTPSRPCMGLRRTLRVFMYVVVETRDNTVRFKLRSNDER